MAWLMPEFWGHVNTDIWEIRTLGRKHILQFNNKLNVQKLNQSMKQLTSSGI